jgi:hypothetical protein
MAKKAMIERDKKRERRMIAKYAAKRAELKKILSQVQILPTRSSTRPSAS